MKHFYAMQYKIPQNVGIEDKIFFFLTLKQLIICGVGASFCYILYVMFKELGMLTWLLPSIVILLITAFIAFVQFNMMSFTRLTLRILELNMAPAKRMFGIIPDPVTPLRTLEFTYEQTARATPAKVVTSVAGLETDIHKITDFVDLQTPRNGGKQ